LAGGTTAPPAKSTNDLFAGYSKIHDAIELSPIFSQHLGKRFSLGHGTREPIQDESTSTRGLSDPVSDESDHHRIRNELSLIHITLRFQTKLGLVPNCFPEKIPG
jgi:hypothetical protein